MMHKALRKALDRKLEVALLNAIENNDGPRSPYHDPATH